MIRVLDCTLRDGGQGLEDADKNNIPLKYFEANEIKTLVRLYTQTNIDIIELGSIDKIDKSNERFCTFSSIEEISKIKPPKNENQMYAALFRGPDISLEDIPNYREDLVECVRVIIRYSELQKSIEFCKGLSNKGYKVFIQPMLTVRYSEAELEYIIDSANKMKAYALYFVDSYGYMTEKDVNRFYTLYDSKLNKDITIGFHAHNNMDMAVANSIAFLHNNDNNRNIIIDACALGIGQGAGNLQSEVITHYLNENYDKKYNISAVLEICEKIEVHNINSLWGYSLNKYVPAKNKVAYKYAVALKNKFNLNITQIDWLLANIPEELRHRYTEDNVNKLMQLFKE